MRGKWNFAIGTTSRVPDFTMTECLSGYHYLILDFDTKAPIVPLLCETVWQKTQSGWHVYTPLYFSSLNEMLNIALDYGADPVWCQIAAKRGYAFLADKNPVALPWPVERMVIGRDG